MRSAWRNKKGDFTVMATAEYDEVIVSEFEDDVTCPVCFETLTEPVVFPCTHEVCQSCFHQNLSAANFHCPICRQRISSWARRRVRDPVDVNRKKELEKQRRDAVEPARPREQRRVIAESGEVHEEYLKELRMVEEERRQEEELGRQEALRLSETAQIEKDYQYASELEERIKHEELLRREQEEKDRKYAEQLNQFHSKLPLKVSTKAVSKKKGDNQQLPITIWLRKQ